MTDIPQRNVPTLPLPYYEDDAVTLYHGDCAEILPLLPACHALITDPPYAVSVSGAAHVGRRGKGTRNLDFFEGDDDWPMMVARVVERVGLAEANVSAGTAYVFCGHRQFGPLTEMFESRGWSTRFVIWRKKCPAPVPPGSGWVSGAELCLYAYKTGRVWNEGVAPDSNVLTFDSYRYGQPGKVDHPTQKPAGLVNTLMAVSTNPGDVVLDPFAGSGTTLRAAKDLGRRAIGVECEERFCSIIANRLSQEVLAVEAA